MATLTGISSMATKLVLAELAAEFERRSGHRVQIESVGGVDAARRVQSGEAFDFVVLASNVIDALVAAGRVRPGSRTDLVRSGVAVAVRAGAPVPDISSDVALKQAVLTARTVGYSTGPSGVQLAQLFERWGITAQIASRLVQAPPGVPVGTLVARGEVELGFQQLSELLHLEGIHIVGGLPPEIQITTTFTGAIVTGSSQAAAAGALLAFMAGPDAAEAKRRHGMEPA